MNTINNVLVIGGGIAGVSIPRLLARAGIKTKLLERGSQLCVGSTWHAAGLVTRFAGSAKLKKINVRSLEIMIELNNKHEGALSLHLPGSIRIIEKNNNDRLLEAKQHLAMAKLYDTSYKTELITPLEIKALHPFININNIQAGLYTPMDGDVDPTQLTNCLAKEAKLYGAELIFNQRVEAVNIKKGEFIIKTQDNEYKSDVVINAAGLWSRNISNMVGLHQPSKVIEHQYVITENVPLNDPVPVIRDLKGSSYIRKEGKGFLIGPYEDNCVISWKNSPPDTWNDMDLFPENLERITSNLLHAMSLIPAIENVGIKRIINGPTIWTGDSLPRVGSTSIPGWYDFNSLTYGIAQSLGLAEYLFGVMKGTQPFDAVDYFNPSRYGDWTNDSYIDQKIQETYSYNNSIVYPFENRSAGNDVSKYPLFDVLKEDGAEFGPLVGGVAVPMVYNTDAQVSDLKTFHNFPWANKVMTEAENVLQNVGLSYAFFSKILVKGTDAREFLDRICISNLPKKKGTCKLAYMISKDGNKESRELFQNQQDGRLVSEFTICPVDDGFYLVGSGGHASYDVDWLRLKAMNINRDLLLQNSHEFDNLSLSLDVTVENQTDSIDILHIAGPNSLELLLQIEPRMKDLSFMKMKEIENFGSSDINLNIFRVSFTGCLGYELHIDRNRSVDLYQFIRNHPISKEMNLELFGSMALNSLRIEKGFKIYQDMNYAHYLDASIEPFTSKKKSRNSVSMDGRKATMFRVHTDKGWEWSVIADSPIMYHDSVVGYITSSALGAVTKNTIAMGFLDKNITMNNNCYVNCYGHKWKINILNEPPVKMELM